MLPAVSFFEGFQTPAGLEKTRARSCGRHLKPITLTDMDLIFGRSRSTPISGPTEIKFGEAGDANQTECRRR
jgi:hypothetical protein